MVVTSRHKYLRGPTRRIARGPCSLVVERPVALLTTRAGPETFIDGRARSSRPTRRQLLLRHLDISLGRVKRENAVIAKKVRRASWTWKTPEFVAGCRGWLGPSMLHLHHGRLRCGQGWWTGLPPGGKMQSAGRSRP